MHYGSVLMFWFVPALHLFEDTFAASHRFAYITENITVSFTIVRVALLQCLLDEGQGDDVITWSQVSIS